MTIHIGSLETEVAVEPTAAAHPEAAPRAMDWEEQTRIAAHRARLLRDEARTRARDYDD